MHAIYESLAGWISRDSTREICNKFQCLKNFMSQGLQNNTMLTTTILIRTALQFEKFIFEITIKCNPA